MAVVSNVVGAVTDSTARVIGRVDSGDSSIRLAVDTDPAFPSPTFFGPQSPDAQDVVDITATGLTAQTQYHFALEVDDTLDTSFPGKFRTFVADGTAHSFRIAAIGDAGLNPDTPGTGTVLASDRLSNHAVFDTVRSYDPDLTCHLGDLHYYDLGSDNHGISGGASLDNYRRAYDDVLLQPRQHQLYRETAWVYLWDDHDYGPNNSDRTHSGRDNAGQVYRERVPSYPLEEDGTADNSAIYHSFQIGRVLFIASDVRYHRDPNDDPQSAAKTMLGAAQETWLTDLLASSSAELCVWLMPEPFPSGPNASGDQWGSFADERQALMDAFRANGWTGRLLVLSADIHALALDHGTAWTNIDGGDGPVSWVCAALDSTPGNPDDVWDDGFQAGRAQYVIIDVTDIGDQLQVQATGYQDVAVWDFSMQHTQPGMTTPPLLDLDYQSQHISPPFEPTDDDQQTRNDVTVSRRDGSSAREVDQGSISRTRRYDESVTLNVAGDDQLRDQAGWRVHLGTTSGLRYPQVTVDLARNRDLAGDVAALESGDRVTVANPLSPPLPPGDIDLLAQGYEEELDSQSWTVTVNASPGDPWIVGELDSSELGRLDTTGSELDTAIGAGDTSFDVLVTGAAWVDGSQAAFVEHFDGGLTGQHVTADNTAYDAVDVQTSSNGSVTFSGTTIQQGQSAHLVTDATGTFLQMRRDFTEAQDEGYTRYYLQLNQEPTDHVFLGAALDIATGNTRAQLRIRSGSDRRFQIRNEFTAVATSSEVCPLGDPVRLLWHLDLDAGTQTLEIHITDPEGTTPDETIQGTLDTGTWDRIADGAVVSCADLDMHMDAIGADPGIAPGPSGPFDDQFPFDVKLGGEVVTVTAISGTSSPQTVTAVRGTNGVSKSHAAGTALSLANPLVLAL